MEYPNDKAMHLVVSLVLTLVFAFALGNLIISSLLTLIIGVARELNDQKKGKNTMSESIKDMAANIAGILIADIIYYGVEIY